MRNILATLFLALFAFSANAERIDYFATSFDGGMPADALSLDVDQQTLHFTMVQAGFDQSDAWKVFTLDGNSYAASPARHKVAKGETALAADDWMVLPAVRIMDADATLTWQARTIAESIEEGCSYEVRVSTVGNQPEDFTEAPLLTVEAEEMGAWTRRSVSLTEYAGREVWIAFRHTSLNREILAIDNICVSGSPGLYRLEDTTSPYVFHGGILQITATLTATSSQPISRFTAYCAANKVVLSRTFEGLSLTAGSAPFSFSFDTPYCFSPGDRKDYKLWVEVDGNTGVEQPPLEGFIMSYAFQPHRRTVVEEGTGMWCGYCPRGIEAMRLMREKYPDDFLGIAVHYDDVLGAPANVAAYCSDLHFPSFPSAYVNRTDLCGDPYPQGADGQYTLLDGGLESHFLAAQAIPAPADLDLTWALLPSGKLGLAMDSYFAIKADDCDYRFTAVAVEDEVSHSSYYQTNYYSGAAQPMGGFETEDKKIVPFTFHEVARACLLPFEGHKGDIPAQVYDERHYRAEAEVTAPPYDRLENLSVILMLVDAHTGHVVNAVRAHASSVEEYEDVLAGVDTPLLAPSSHLPQPSYRLDGRRAFEGIQGIYIKGGKKVLR